MNITEIKEKAKRLGVEAGKLTKGDLIRAIQKKEGNFPCFETAKDFCDQLKCAWRKACLPSKKGKETYAQTRDRYTKKIKAQIEELTSMLAELKKKSRKAVGKGKEEALEEIRKLEKKSEELAKKVHELADAGEDAWETAKKGIDKAWGELQRSLKKALAKFG